MRARWVDFQSPLAEPIRAFLAHKRALGCSFETEAKTLRLFDRFLTDQVVDSLALVSPALVDSFLASRPRKQPRSYNHLLGTLRRLFTWLVAQGTLCENPVQASPRRVTHQQPPFLFDVPLVQRLLEAARRLPDNPRARGRGPTYSMIFALLFGLGLRVGEVARLRGADVDLERRLLVIRHTKFSKSRLVPMGPRLAKQLAEYLRRVQDYRDPIGSEDAMFSFTRGKPIHPGTISQTFHHLLPALALELPPGVAPPRVHDLRHAFAVATLLRWYRAGLDPAQRLIHLSTFLGHVDPTSTAVYLTITDELLREASQRFERFAAPLLVPGDDP